MSPSNRSNVLKKTGGVVFRKETVAFRVAILYAEKRPVECHRFYLLSKYFQKEFTILHILADGSLISQEKLEAAFSENRIGFEEMDFPP